MKLDVSPAALAELAKVGFDPVFGARPLKRAIQQRIENPVAKLILRGPLRPEGRDPGRRSRRASSSSGASCTDLRAVKRSGRCAARVAAVRPRWPALS